MSAGQRNEVERNNLDLLVFTRSGQSTYASGNQEFRVKEGDLLYLPRERDAVHWKSGPGGEWHVSWLFGRLTPHQRALVFGDETGVRATALPTTGLTRLRIGQAFERIGEVQALQSESAEVLRWALVDVILAELRIDAGNAPDPMDTEIAAAKAYLDSRINTPTSIDDLVQMSNMGRTRLVTGFTEAVGMSPMRYLEERRLAVAAQRLQTSNVPVGAIARSVGYGNQRYFANRFRRRFGASPTEWRNTREVS